MMASICFEDVCKCAPPDGPDECGCRLAAGAALIDGVPCLKCNAPLYVFDWPVSVRNLFKKAMANRARLRDKLMQPTFDPNRQLFVGFRAKLLPKEVREISTEMQVAFQLEKLRFAPLLQSRAQRFVAYLWHVPWMLATTMGLTRPSWRAPWPGPPIEVINVKVDGIEQFLRTSPLPSELFITDVTPFLGLTDVIRPGRKVCLIVRNLSSKPYDLRGGFFGKAVK
jgi:hypothetical protein